MLAKLPSSVDAARVSLRLSQSKPFRATCAKKAKPKRSDYPAVPDNCLDEGLWLADMVDEALAVTPSGNRYKTIFVIAKVRYIMIFLHKNKDATTFEEILLKAIAQAGQKPKILRTDGALEYLDMGVAATLLKLGSFKQTTNPHHQLTVSPTPQLARANLSRLAGGKYAKTGYGTSTSISEDHSANASSGNSASASGGNSITPSGGNSVTPGGGNSAQTSGGTSAQTIEGNSAHTSGSTSAQTSGGYSATTSAGEQLY